MRKTGNDKDKTELKMLLKIIEDEKITPVYQPIVSLKDAQIFGYEALSRISFKSLNLNIEYLFRLAEKKNKLWELEKLCRKKALKNAKYMNTEKKLFLNVDPNIIHDAEFKNGFTKSRLTKYGLNSLDIAFEITERDAILNKEIFLGAINHYREQNFHIAIDDVGSGYSGLNTINDIKPDIIKLDMNLIRNIDKDEIKQHLCKALIDFGKNADIKVIVEGIETKEELQTLIKLNAEFGQGFLLGIPQEEFTDIVPETRELIKKYQKKIKK